MDPQAASEWIATLPNTQAKDSAISGLVDYLVEFASEPDPEAAAHWATASLETTAQERRLEQVAKAWFARSPEQAPAQIEASSLSGSVKEFLLRYGPSHD